MYAKEIKILYMVVQKKEIIIQIWIQVYKFNSVKIQA